MNADAILASGHYIDRKGRTWRRGFRLWAKVFLADPWSSPVLTPAQMRLLIVRDLHRSECPGLRDCDDHPVPHVVIWLEGPTAHDTRTDTEVQRDTLAEAITAARRMTGETP